MAWQGVFISTPYHACCLEGGDDDIGIFLAALVCLFVGGTLLGVIGEQLKYNLTREAYHAELVAMGIPDGKITDEVLKSGEGAEGIAVQRGVGASVGDTETGGGYVLTGKQQFIAAHAPCPYIDIAKGIEGTEVDIQ